MSRHPEMKWAQRSDKVFLTVELPDAKNPQVKIEPEGKFIFSATVGQQNVPYELDLPLYGKANVEESKISVGLRNVFCVLQKAETGWWKRLLKTEGKQPPYLKVDWDKWVDEDEEDEPSSKKSDNFDLGSMNDFSDFTNMGGAGMEGIGGDESDTDDEDDEMSIKAEPGKEGAGLDEEAEMSIKTEAEGASQVEDKKA